ncbi:MAG: HlyD family efflux transporter periplasmic adaptor subunit [Patescibacteria group bacterium]
MKNPFRWLLKHKKVLWTGVGVVVVGGFFIFHAFQNKVPPTRYVLESVQKGTLTTSVSGSGQISTSGQIELKATGTGTVLALNVKKGDSVKQGQLLLQLDASDAAKAVRDANVNLQSAQLAYQKFIAPTDALTLLQAQNAVAQAQRTLETLKNGSSISDLQNAKDAVVQAEQTLESAKRSREEIQTKSAQSVTSAYENGYGSVVKAFIDLPNVFSDLADLFGTSSSQDYYIGYYKVLIDSGTVDKLVLSEEVARDVYDVANAAYIVSRGTSENGVKEVLIKTTLDAEKKAFETISDAHKMLQAIKAVDYSHSAVQTHIDQMIPVISADITLLNNGISSLQSAIDAIETIKTQGPNDLADANDAVTQAAVNLSAKQRALQTLQEGLPKNIASAEESLSEKKQQLANLKNGPDPLDIQSQLLTVTQRKNALADAQRAYLNDATHAPMDGIVANLSVHVGDQISSGTILATIISAQQIADLSLNEVDVAKMKIGQPATLLFDALEDLTLTGHVADIDAIGTVTQGVVSYRVKIVLDVVDERVKSGMSVSANILTEAHQNVLIVSTSAVKLQGSTSYVEVLDHPNTSESSVTSSSSPRQIPVTIGLSNDTQTEILSGIGEGDQVITRTITGTQTTTPTGTSQTPSLFGSPTGGTRVRGGFGG